jgi:hypothetical protein
MRHGELSHADFQRPACRSTDCYFPVSLKTTGAPSL